MFNLVNDAKVQIKNLILDAYAKAAQANKLPAGAVLDCAVEIPRDSVNGDFSTNFAMAAAKLLRKSPRDIANLIIEYSDLTGSFFKKIEAAGPGFINFTVSTSWYNEILRAVDSDPENYGRTADGNGKTVMVEFVSANPTGPMTIGNARGGVLGDAISSVLDFAGWKVHREFYLNDAGNQILLFGKSIDARYTQLIRGEDAVTFPEDGYHGEYIRDIALAFREEHGDAPLEMPEDERIQLLTDFGLAINIERMKADLARYGIVYDTWFPETSLHNSGYVQDTIDHLTSLGHTYEKDGALWFRASSFDLEKDEVLIKANGFYTYYAVDIAYHRNKFQVRKFDRVIDAFGADHHGHTLRFMAGMAALGIDSSKLDFLLFQLVHLRRGDETVRMSKRTGMAITLGDLLDEIPRDAARFFFNFQKPETHLDFDLDLAIKQTGENPVYYVQYAHARICSLLKNLAEEGSAPSVGEAVDCSVLHEPAELDLIKLIGLFPEEIHLSARDLDPSVVNKYLIDLSAAFHKFYNSCRIRGESDDIKSARLLLVKSTGSVIKTGLNLIGVSAPESM